MVDYEKAKESATRIDQADGYVTVLDAEERKNLIDLIGEWCEQNHIDLDEPDNQN